MEQETTGLGEEMNHAYVDAWDVGLCFNVCIYFTWNTALTDHFIKHSLQFTLINNLMNIWNTEKPLRLSDVVSIPNLQE